MSEFAHVCPLFCSATTIENIRTIARYLLDDADDDKDAPSFTDNDTHDRFQAVSDCG